MVKTPADSRLPDDSERKEIRSRIVEDFVVVAGAGTGKTQLISDRMLGCFIDGGAEPREVLAITFTEAAAAEMKERIEGQLAGLVKSGDEKRAKRAKDVLVRIDEATICTIHAFARSLLARFPIQAGVPVNFDVVDETLYMAGLTEAWLDFLRTARSEERTGRLLAAAEGFGLQAKALERLAGAVYPLWGSTWTSVAEEAAAVDSASTGCIVDQLRSAESKLAEHAAELSDLAAKSNRDPAMRKGSRRTGETAGKGWEANVEAAAETLSELADLARTATDPEDIHLFALRLTGCLSSTLKMTKRQQSSAPEELTRAVETCTRLHASLASHCAQELLALAERFLREQFRSRIAAGELTFQDLLLVAERLLAEHADVAEALSRRYKHVFVDEFQDTDPLQVSLIFRVLRRRMPHAIEKRLGGSGAAQAEQEATERAERKRSRLVVVGDPKQSIYSFRGADPELISELAAAAERNKRVLRSNFRSHPEIIQFVNSVFERCFDRDRWGSPIGHEDLIAARPSEGRPDEKPESAYVSGAASEAVVASASGVAGARAEKASETKTTERSKAARVVVLGGPTEGKEQAAQRRRAEFRHIAQRMRRLVEEEGIRYKDIAVLVRARTGLVELEAEFDRCDIPYRLETGSLLYWTQDAWDLRAVLEALCDPGNQVAVVAALKSSFFCVSDQDLLDHYLASGQSSLAWSFLGRNRAPAEAAADADLAHNSTVIYGGDAAKTEWDQKAAADSGAVAGALRRLREFYTLSRSVSVGTLVSEIVRRQAAAEAAVGETLVESRRRERLRRLRLLEEDARRFSSESNGGIREFLRWMDVQREGGAFVVESAYPEPDEDAVRVMTIHAAKGLEFRAVFVAGLSWRQAGSGSVEVVSLPGGDPELKLGSQDLKLMTPGYEEARLDAAKNRFWEDLRLAYVALTRAKDYLFVSLYGSKAARTASSRSSRPNSVASRSSQARSASGRPAGNRPLPQTAGQALHEVLSELEAEGCFEDGKWVWERSTTGADHEPSGEHRSEREGSQAEAVTTAGWEAAGSLVRDTRLLVLQRLTFLEGGLAASPPVFSATAIAKSLAPYDFSAPPSRSPADATIEGDGAYSAGEAETRSEEAEKAGQGTGEPATGAADELGASDSTRAGRKAASTEGRNRHVGGLGIGQSVHQVLSRVDLARGKDESLRRISELARDLEQAEARSVFELASKALETPTVKLASTKRHWQELYVAAPGPSGCAVEGYCDLLIEDGEGYVVADYKTDVLEAAADPSSLVEHYSFQIAAYAYAVERATGRPVTRGVLIFLGGPEPREVEVEGLRERIEAVHRWVEERANTRRRLLEEARSARS